MQIIRGEKAGFCMGVALALKKLDKAVATYGSAINTTDPVSVAQQVCTMGAIIHNPQVLEEYAAQGVGILKSPEEAEGRVVLIRAHGIPVGEEEYLRACATKVLDATCPRVKKAQLAIRSATAKGESLLLYGEEKHPEVAGLVSYAQGPVRVFSEKEDLADFHHTGPLVLAAQTTQSLLRFEEICVFLRQRMGESLHVLHTICPATEERQAETLAIARNVDAMVVVGGRESGNTRRLAELAASCGVPAYLLETEKELKAEKFCGFTRIGLTAGASTPKRVIDNVENTLSRLLI